MRLMTLIKLVKLFVLQASPTHYRSPTLAVVLIHHVPPEVEHLVTTVSVSLETTNITIYRTLFTYRHVQTLMHIQ
jgi:hypothetical protein